MSEPVPLSVSKCGCSEASIGDIVRTCPECVGAAFRYWAGEEVDQGELFEYVDRPGSVSDLSTGTGLTHISEVLRSSGRFGAEDLPF